MKQLYIDMDGVLSNFNKQYTKYFKKSVPKKIDTPQWDYIHNNIGIKFWSKMEWLTEGIKLWNCLKSYSPIILTAPTQNNISIVGKKIWLNQNLPGVNYIIDAKKELYATPDDILIDDRERNIIRWKTAKGIGILYTGDVDNTITQVEKYL